MFDCYRVEGNEIVVNVRDISPDDLLYLVDLITSEFLYDRKDLIKIKGDAPIWLYISLCHLLSYLVNKAIAVYDASAGGYVVVISHHPEYKIGQVIT